MKSGIKIAVAAAFLAALWIFGGADAQQRTIVGAEYNIGAYQTDAARAIELAEKVAIQGRQDSQLQLVRIESKLDAIMQGMHQIDKELLRLNARLGRIELKLGISADVEEPVQTPAAGATTEPNPGAPTEPNPGPATPGVSERF